MGMGIGCIPLSEITDYGERLGEDDMDAFIDIIQHADRAYLVKKVATGTQ